MRDKINHGNMIGMFSLAMLALSLFIVILPNNFAIMLLRSFCPHLILISGLSCFVALYLQRKRAAIVGLISCILLTAQIAPVFGERPALRTHQQSIVVGQFNVLKFNKDHKRTIDAALESGCDIIAFQEVDEKWSDSLVRGLCQSMPYYIVIPSEDCYGIAVFSKYALMEVEVLQLYGFAALSGKFCVGNKALDFLALHSKAPTTSWNFALRNAQLRLASQHWQQEKRTGFVMGDFNAVPWDPEISRLTQSCVLSFSRRSLLPTFPAQLGIIGIPIDYILHTEDLVCQQIKSLNTTSSDHQALIGSYRLVNSQNNLD